MQQQRDDNEMRSNVYNLMISSTCVVTIILCADIDKLIENCGHKPGSFLKLHKRDP